VNILAHEAILAFLLSAASMFVWSVLFGMHLRHRIHHEERRLGNGGMYLVGLIASVGFFASAWAFGIREGVAPVVSLEFLAFTASVGRGALFMGGVALLVINTHQHPVSQRKEVKQHVDQVLPG
jgi:hypothetical protein